MFLIEDESLISEYCQQIIDNQIMGADFPWYYLNYSTSTKFPFLGHTLIPRSNDDAVTREPVSNYYNFFYDIFNTACIIHGLKVDRILRASLNLSTHFSAFPYGDPHVDHMFPHYNMLMYLNDCTNGSTIIFKEQTNGEISQHPVNEVNETMTIEKEIIPKKGKIVIFDGLHFHANRFCVESERRVVCVFTFTTKND
jgi:hypothetical protein